MSSSDGSRLIWKRERLSKPYLLGIQQRMFASAASLLLCDTFLQTMREASQLTWAEIKKWSNEGFVYRRKRSYDEGNYAYSVLFFVILRVARGEASEALHGLLKRFVGLMLSDGYNEDKMVERQGDIIECMLAKASLTGPAIGHRDRGDRIRFHQQIKEFLDDFTHLTQCLCGEWTPYLSRPPTRNVVEELDFVLHRDEAIASSVQNVIDSGM